MAAMSRVALAVDSASLRTSSATTPADAGDGGAQKAVAGGGAEFGQAAQLVAGQVALIDGHGDGGVAGLLLALHVAFEPGIVGGIAGHGRTGHRAAPLHLTAWQSRRRPRDVAPSRPPWRSTAPPPTPPRAPEPSAPRRPPRAPRYSHESPDWRRPSHAARRSPARPPRGCRPPPC
jgi:hypothetical protein